MLAMAAREMGYHVRALDPDPRCAARFSVEEHLVASFDDEAAAERLGRSCDVVTLEIEKIATSCLDAAGRAAPVRPGSAALEIIQNRARQKTFLDAHGLPVGPFRVVRSAEQLGFALLELGGVCFVKAAAGGYDGRGQFETTSAEQAAEAWSALKASSCVVEKALAIDAELSVLVARAPSGALIVYPPALNHHVDRVLAWSVLPAPIEPRVAERVRELARAAAEALSIEGLLCIEFFVLGGDVLVNELAPRPHNSYHASVVGSATSQFEQCVRAICDLPLGSVDTLRPAAIANLLGDAWLGASPPSFDAALELPGVRVHLYGKTGARPGRKMGHLSASAATAEEAVALVQLAKTRLTR